MPAANLQTICSSGALLQPCVALFTCPQPFVHARSKSQSWVCVCVPVLAVLPGLGVCVCASPGFRPWTGCVCVCASPGCVRQSWLFFQDWVCVCVCVPVLAVLPGLGVCARWFFQDWVCVCVCQSWLPSIGCVCQSDHLQLWHPFAAVHCPFCLSAAICACPQTICSSGALFMLAAFYSLFMVAQPFNSQGFDNHFCSLIASIFRCPSAEASQPFPPASEDGPNELSMVRLALRRQHLQEMHLSCSGTVCCSSQKGALLALEVGFEEKRAGRGEAEAG